MPEALTKLDGELGTDTRGAYSAAISAAPHLQVVEVESTNGQARFLLGSAGLADSKLQISSDREYYLDAIRSGIASRRMHEYSRLYRAAGITPGVNELVVAVLLHEMGHAEDYSRYVDDANGDTQAAFALSRSVRKAQLASLPLQAATSQAVKAWSDNTDGYQDRVRALGYTDELWQEMVTKNTEAYGKLPCELVADRFALGVLATVRA